MDGFKQRIIGALIIVSLAVIFLPMLFDEPHQARREQTLEVPPEPEMEPVEVEQPREPEMPESEEAPEIPTADEGEVERDGARDEKITATRDEPEPDPVSEAEPTPEVEQEESGALRGAWLVRLGSFSNRDNALKLRDSVRDQGMDAHSETVENDKGTFTRVFAGPFVDEQKAVSAMEQLESEFNLEAMVVEGEE
ncbi:SPOR domain-containing protein [uncultured Halovibrio sp.]|uniref:SPOR domain-containing protein n=1 Tax=uncultured Halovibrio sp. TaxID=985049 RepID=UPI0025DEA34C|nr:SPOR domain-containing protein [uncultured Halovibrio sp.]